MMTRTTGMMARTTSMMARTTSMMARTTRMIPRTEITVICTTCGTSALQHDASSTRTILTREAKLVRSGDTQGWHMLRKVKFYVMYF